MGWYQWVQFIGTSLELVGLGVMLWEWHKSWSVRHEATTINMLVKTGFRDTEGKFHRVCRDPQTKKCILPGTPEMDTFERLMGDVELDAMKHSQRLFFIGAFFAIGGLALSALGSLPR